MTVKRPADVSRQDWPAEILSARPYRNESMRLEPRPDGGVVASVPLRRPRYLVPPISWVIPFSRDRRVQLDALGAGVLELCDGRRTVEQIIEKLANDNKLSFRESQIPVLRFLRQLTERGLVVIVGTDKDAEER